jgi:predicted nucleic acid-binding protein
LQTLDAAACWVNVPPEISAQTFCRDADDDQFIHAALAARATLLVSGDRDLLCLNPLGGLRIVAPREALDEIAYRGSR